MAHIKLRQNLQYKVPDDCHRLRVELENQKRIKNLIIDIFTSLASSTAETDSTVIDATLDKLGSFIQADRIYVGLYDFQHKVINITHEWLAPDIAHMHFAWNISFEMDMEMLQHHREGNLFTVENTDELSEGMLKDFLLLQKVKNCQAAPMMDGDRCIGFVGLDSVKHLKKFTDEELELLISYSNALAGFHLRINALKYLRHSEELHRAIAENAPAMICEYLPDGTLTFVNQEYAYYHGATREEMIGVSFLNFVDEIHREELRRIYLSLTPENPENVTKQSFYNLGKLKWQEWRTKAFFDEVGRPIRYQAVGIDITESKNQMDKIKKQEALINGLLDSIPDLVFFKDLEDTFMGCNTPYAEFYGLTKENIVGKSNYDFVSRELADYYRSLHKKVIEQQRTLAQEEWEEDREGNRRLFETLIAPLFADGEIIGTIAISRDMTEKWQLRQSLEEAKMEAEVANENKSRFLANMSHEIRSPLHGMMGMIGLLRMAETLDEQEEYLRLAERAAENLLQLTNKVLDYSKVESRELVLKQEKFIVDELLYDVEIMSHSLLTDSDVVFSIHKSDSVPDELIGDETRLKQVLNNLVSNAVKFTEKGKIEIEVSIIKDPQNNENRTVTLLFHVTDTGIGVPEDFIDHIFDTFAQASGTERSKFGGTGLGLAISKSIVTQMGGDIWVKSEEGVGTKFSFTCKLEQPE